LVSRLIPLEINIGRIIDIAYNGTYLFVATEKNCRFYQPERNYRLIAGFNIKSHLEGALWMDYYLLLFTRDKLIQVIDTRQEFAVVKTDKMKDEIPVDRLRYSYNLSTQNIRYPLRFLSHHENRVVEFLMSG
jgi:hypothetical protein